MMERGPALGTTARNVSSVIKIRDSMVISSSAIKNRNTVINTSCVANYNISTNRKMRDLHQISPKNELEHLGRQHLA